jgi:hypothetical protein
LQKCKQFLGRALSSPRVFTDRLNPLKALRQRVLSNIQHDSARAGTHSQRTKSDGSASHAPIHLIFKLNLEPHISNKTFKYARLHCVLELWYHPV